MVKKGAVLAASPLDAAAGADIVFEVTANDESASEIWIGSNGLFDQAEPGQYLITCATLSVQKIDELTDIAKTKGLKFFDMPMTGGRDGAEAGQLILLAGGEKAGVDDLRHVCWIACN